MSDRSIRRPNRRGRGGAGATATPPPVTPGMAGGQFQPLTRPETERIHHLALRLLEDLGLSQVTPSLERRATEDGCASLRLLGGPAASEPGPGAAGSNGGD